MALQDERQLSGAIIHKAVPSLRCTGPFSLTTNLAKLAAGDGTTCIGTLTATAILIAGAEGDILHKSESMKQPPAPMSPTSRHRQVLVLVNEGLGNQLFNYAFGRSLAERAGAQLVLDHRSQYRINRFGRRFLLDNFHIRAQLATWKQVLSGTLALASWKSANYFKAAPQLGPIFTEPRNRQFVQIGAELLARKTVFAGYWQDERYFFEVATQLRNELQPVTELPHAARRLRDVITSSNSVCCHVRSFSEIGGGADLTSYYRRAVDHLCERHEVQDWFVFSDNHAFASQILPSHVQWTHVDLELNSIDSAIVDLWLMSQFAHHILSLSTLAWWGAWLSTRPGTIVLPVGAPSIGMAAPFKDVVPIKFSPESTSTSQST